MVMSPICESVRPLCSARIWDDLSPQFFATFWSLTVNDLSVPTAAYEREVARLRLQITQLNENREMPASKRKKEQDRCLALGTSNLMDLKLFTKPWTCCHVAQHLDSLGVRLGFVRLTVLRKVKINIKRKIVWMLGKVRLC